MFHLPENQQTGISRFDSQHRELFGYFNRIHLAVKNRRPLREIIPLLHELSDFIETHCAAEEKAMEQARYSGIAAHKSDHRKMLNDMQSQLRRLEETGDVNIIELCMSLKDWVTNHIEEMDHKYIPVLQAIGMN
jgi:hemerythrin